VYNASGSPAVHRLDTAAMGPSACGPGPQGLVAQEVR
jgi:hypothetical protein